MKDEYVPFGPEWEKEMMRWTKKQLIAHIRRLLVSHKSQNVNDKGVKCDGY